MGTDLKQHSFELSIGNDLFLRGNVHMLEEEPKSKKPVVILCHGFKGHKDWGFFPYAADYLASQGFCAIRFNFSCNGVKETDFDELEKFAVNTFSQEIKDLQILFQHIKKRKLPASSFFDLNNIAVVGHSRGGGSSILFAADEPEIKLVVTWNGIWNVDFLGEDMRREAEEKGVAYIVNARTKQNMPIKSNFFEDIDKNKEAFNILQRLSEINIPVLVIQGEKDREWLVEGSTKMAGASPQHQYIPIPDANHTFQAVHPFKGTTPSLEKVLEETSHFLKVE